MGSFVRSTAAALLAASLAAAGETSDQYLPLFEQLAASQVRAIQVTRGNMQAIERAPLKASLPRAQAIKEKRDQLEPLRRKLRELEAGEGIYLTGLAHAQPGDYARAGGQAEVLDVSGRYEGLVEYGYQVSVSKSMSGRGPNAALEKGDAYTVTQRRKATAVLRGVATDDWKVGDKIALPTVVHVADRIGGQEVLESVPWDEEILPQWKAYWAAEKKRLLAKKPSPKIASP